MRHFLSRRRFLETGAGLAASGLGAPVQLQAKAPAVAGTLETATFRLVLGLDASCLHFYDKHAGRDYALPDRSKFARARISGHDVPAASAQFESGKLHLDFAVNGVKIVLRAQPRKRFLTLEIEKVMGGPFEELHFVDLPLALGGKSEEPFAVCVLARNPRTQVPEYPRPTGHLLALAYPELGVVGASVALVATPQAKFRAALQEAVADAPELPHSRLGGPWALDAPTNRGSYLFNFGGIARSDIDFWIDLARRLGMTQIDFNGSFRYGDFRPDPTLYPGGRPDVKAVIDRLHGAGIAAGLHTYAFFLAKDTPWVTPVPDPRLATSRTFTLAADLDPNATTIPVVESTAGVSPITGFFVRNSATLRVGEELILFRGVSERAPFAFTQCQRGVLGTKASAHPRGTKVGHLKECFGLFAPDPDSTLLGEIAALTAETYNQCGFDMIYLDALDGSDVLDKHRGGEFAWHYGARFAFEVAKRLHRPAVFEMSTFSHHLWFLRSRYAAWDHPNRSYKRFIDLHCAANEESRRMFLPGELGWWALKVWEGAQTEPTFPDDIEYLLAKGLANDTGFALMGIDPKTAATTPALPRLADLIRRWETMRLSGKVPAALKDRLRTPGAEFTLEGDVTSGWSVRPVEYLPHRVEAADPRTQTWSILNRHGRQPLALRIEALLSAGPHDAPGNPPVLADFSDAADFPTRAAQQGVSARWEPVRDLVNVGPFSGRFTATSRVEDRKSAWAQFEKRFDPPLDLSRHQGLGLWVHGDGSGALLNLQLRSPSYLVSGIADHYVTLDFQGWRYVALVEPEGERWSHYRWPYGDAYSIYREVLQFPQVASLGVWLNDLPPGRPVVCHLDALRAVPLVSAKLTNPALTVGEAKVIFPCSIESGSYLEFHPPGPARLYGPSGESLGEVPPKGQIPTIQPGTNAIQFHGDAPARVRVTVITRGEPIRA